MCVHVRDHPANICSSRNEYEDRPDAFNYHLQETKGEAGKRRQGREILAGTNSIIYTKMGARDFFF